LKPRLKWNLPQSLRRNHSVGCGNQLLITITNNYLVNTNSISWETMTETMTMTNFITETSTTVDVSLLVSVAVVTLTEVLYEYSFMRTNHRMSYRTQSAFLILEDDTNIDLDGYIDYNSLLWPIGHVVTNSSQCCNRLQEFLQGCACGGWRRRGNRWGRPRET